jgi:anti-sigma factor ChrR (cupin superfamily)
VGRRWWCNGGSKLNTQKPPMETTLIHSDLTQRAVVDTSNLEWLQSPALGVQRRMVERNGAEKARATSIVKYAPGAQFAQHTHDLGEELFVLDGIFEDEHGQYPQGSYIRNPPSSRHSPGAKDGCTLFVKLRHFSANDDKRVMIGTEASPWYPGMVKGLSVMPLHEFESQNTALVRWDAGTYFSPHRHFGGEEIYVLKGVFEDEHGRYGPGTWMRSPHLSTHQPFSKQGCTILVKTGHLPTH